MNAIRGIECGWRSFEIVLAPWGPSADNTPQRTYHKLTFKNKSEIKERNPYRLFGNKMIHFLLLSVGHAQMGDIYSSVQGERLCGRQFSESRGMIKSIMHFGRKRSNSYDKNTAMVPGKYRFLTFMSMGLAVFHARESCTQCIKRNLGLHLELNDEIFLRKDPDSDSEALFLI